MSGMRSLVASLVCLSAFAAPRLALACSVCTAGRDDEANRAFIITTIFLSVTPLAMLGGFGLFLYLRHRQRARAEAPSRVSAAPPAPSLPELS